MVHNDLCAEISLTISASGVVQIRGTMSDCPEKLTTGVSLIVTLHFYIVASAFTPLSTSNSDELPKLTFNEGAETNEETCVRNPS